METTIAYSYDKNEKFFNGKAIARQDPMEPEKFLYPANSTPIAPPSYEEYTIPVFDEEIQEWVIVDDFRGLKIYNKNTGEEKINEKIGPVDEEYTIIPKPGIFYEWDEDQNDWVPSLDLIRQNTFTQIKSDYTKLLKEPIEFEGYLFPTNESNKSEYFGVLSAWTKSSSPDSFVFFTVEGEAIELKYDEVKELSKKILERTQNLNRNLTSALQTTKKMNSIKELQKIRLGEA